MNSKKNTVIKDLITIFIMTIALCILLISGISIFLCKNGFAVFKLHKVVACIFIIATIAHIYIRREKLSKLIKDFISIIKTGDILRKRTKDIIFNPLAKFPLKELCLLYKINIDETIKVLKNKGLKNIQSHNSLKFIADSNKKDPLELFEIIIEKKFKNSS